MAAALPNFRTQIRKELSCSICLDLFTRPKALPCGHTFCQDCLENVAGTGGTVKCPNCRRQVRLPPQGVAGLPDSHIIANMCDRLRQQTSLSGETREQLQSGNRCFHPSEVLKLYCKQCETPVCEQCLEEDHDGHGTTTVKKVAQERSLTAQPLINEGRKIMGSYLSVFSGLREEEEALNKMKQQTYNSIIQDYNQMVQKLRNRKDHLLSEVGENHTKNLDRIQNKKDRVLADINELSAACDQAEQEVQHVQGRAEFLTQQTTLTEVVGKYKQKAAPTPVQTQPAVFQPTDTPVPVLGHVIVQPLPSAPIPAAPASRGAGHHHGNQSHQLQRVMFGGQGTATGQFRYPFGVTVSDEGGIFVADFGNQRIQVFNLQGIFMHQFPTLVSSEQGMRPWDVAMDGEGNLWVVGKTDFADFAVQYNKQGRVLRMFDLQKSGWQRGVAVDTRRNHILITQTTGDWNNWHGEVMVFRPDGTVGQQLGMKFPQYITVDGEGNIIVSDVRSHCVYVYKENGQFQFGGEGSGKGQLYNPSSICTDRAGNIIVADTGNSRVEMFDKTGKFLKHITTDMEMPLAVAMATWGTRDYLVLTDIGEHTVNIFF